MHHTSIRVDATQILSLLDAKTMFTYLRTYAHPTARPRRMDRSRRPWNSALAEA